MQEVFQTGASEGHGWFPQVCRVEDPVVALRSHAHHAFREPHQEQLQGSACPA